jgi:multisubunit Na+/H+ antiporter MnhE subunit
VGANPRRAKAVSLWLWLCFILVIAALIVGGITSTIQGSHTQNVQPAKATSEPPAPITTLKVQRLAPYAGLDITVINAQYATTFTDDKIRPGPATVRLNLQVENHSADQPKIIYYDCVRLLVPDTQPVAPTNTSLASSPKPGSRETGWIDFAVPQDTTLDTLTLQLGSTAISEALVDIPFTGPFDSSHYENKTYPEHDTLLYNFNGHFLHYHLTSVEARFSYQGSQCKVGQQFYVFNFDVDNPDMVNVSPGFGFDYLRLVVNGYSQPPIDNSLPDSFKAGASSVSGHVVFTGPANMHAFTLGFLAQNSSNEQQNFDIQA